MQYVISAHVSYTSVGVATFGPPHLLLEFLTKNKKNVSFIAHDLENRNSSTVLLKNNKKVLSDRYDSNLLFCTLQQISTTIKVVLKIKKPVTYIGVNPINGISGALLLLLRKIDKNIYFSADYSERRFQNQFINYVYHTMDRLALIFASEVWCVSSRIAKKRKEQGVTPTKIRIVPNSPDFNTIKRKKYDGNHSLIIVSHLTESLHLEPILNCLIQLKKKIKDIRLLIIGSGPEENKFRKLVKEHGLTNEVVFLGQKSHNYVLHKVAKSFIGFALYTDAHSWNVYGDSMKAREYVACGIPVIINTVPSTADDVKKYDAGLVLSEIDEEKITAFVERCITDRRYYDQLRSNALRLARDFDISTILQTLFL